MGRRSLQLATLGGLGRMRIAPGTMGSLVGWIIGWWLTPATATTTWWPTSLVYGVVLLVGSLVGVRVCGQLATAQRRADPPQAIFDECIGMLWTMCGWPRDARAWLVGFGLFRLFDITKPNPIHQCERLPGGWGIMLDDVAAGLAANLGLHAIWWIMGW